MARGERGGSRTRSDIEDAADGRAIQPFANFPQHGE